MKLVLRTLRLVAIFVISYISFFMKGRTPGRGYDAMRQLYCLTDGRFNRFCAYIAGAMRPKYRASPISGHLGDFSASEFEAAIERLRKDGYLAFKNPLDQDLVEGLRTFATTTPCYPMNSQYPSGPPILYDKDTAAFPKYDFSPEDLMRNELVQQLVADPQLLAFAQEYLGARATVDSVAMWWSAPVDKAHSDAAQLYHFDMDRLRFVKFFVYLTDVDTDTGPHCYVKGSHSGKARSLREIKRFEDQELRSEYPEPSFVEHLGSAGQILAVDTSGFHKGKPPRSDHRLILEIEFAISLYGANYGRLELPSSALHTPLRTSMDRYPFTYRGFIGRNGEDSEPDRTRTLVR